MNSCKPKNESEWWAKRRIEELDDRIGRYREALNKIAYSLKYFQEEAIKEGSKLKGQDGYEK